MQKRTLDLIIISKNQTRFTKDRGDIVSSIKLYLSEMTGAELNWYDRHLDRVHAIVKKAFYDFLDTCDKPSFHLNMYDQLINEKEYTNKDEKLSDEIGAIMSVFTLTDVCKITNDDIRSNKVAFINGFDESFNERLKELK